MVVGTLVVQFLAALALGTAVVAGLGRPSVRRAAMALRATRLPGRFVYLSVVVAAVSLAVGSGAVPAPRAVTELGTPVLVFLAAGLPVLAFLLSGHLELAVAAATLAEYWSDRDPEGPVERLRAFRHLVRAHHDWASTASFLAGSVGVAAGLGLSLSTVPTERLTGFLFVTVGIYGLLVTALTADYPYYRLEEGPVAAELDRIARARARE